jgi:Phage terminase-like protein, large subunit
MYVTTRGFNPNGELAKLERKHIGLLRNQHRDDSAMSLIFAMDESDEENLKKIWGKPVEELDKSYWQKSNPGLGVAPSMRGLESMYTDAINEGISATDKCNGQEF